MNRNKSPRLRFGGFTGEWEERKLEEVLSIKSGMSQKEIEVSDGIYPILATGGEIGRTNTALYDKESVLIGRKGTIDKPYYMDTPFWTVDTLFYSELKNNVNGKFLYFLFQCIDWRKLDTSTGVPSLTSSTIHEIKRYFPSLPEQTALGNFFRRLDETLAQARARLAKTQQLKRAMLAKLFPAQGETAPKLRFKGFSGDWERKMLGDLAGIVRGASPRPIQDPKWFDDDSDIGWLRIADVSNQNGRIHYLEQKISKAGQEKTRVLEEPHLLLSIAASVGKPVINYVKTGVHDGFLIFKNPKFELEFMFQYLDSFADKWQSFGQPGTQVNLNSDIVKNAELFIPPTPEEQTAIGNFFQKLDQTLALQSAALEKLTQLKKALLAAMLV